MSIVENKLNIIFDFLDVVGKLWITKEEYVIARYLIGIKSINEAKEEFKTNPHIGYEDRNWHMDCANKVFDSLNKDTSITVMDMIYTSLVD